MDAPQVPRVDDPAYPALEPYDSYERFFLGEYCGVVELAYALSGNRAGAEDIAQEAFLRAHRDRSWTVLADFSRYLADNPTAAPPDDDFEPDGAVYSMLKAGHKLYVLEANPGEIDQVSPTSGRIRRVLDISATRPHITPTALASRGGHLYVGNLGSFPIQRGASLVFRVDRNGGRERVVATGLTAVLGLTFDRHGRLYALETTTVDNDFPQPGTGRVVRITRDGQLRPVATGLTFPTGITTGPDGHLYVSEHGYGPDPTAGRILRIRLG